MWGECELASGVCVGVVCVGVCVGVFCVCVWGEWCVWITSH